MRGLHKEIIKINTSVVPFECVVVMAIPDAAIEDSVVGHWDPFDCVGIDNTAFLDSSLLDL